MPTSYLFDLDRLGASRLLLLTFLGVGVAAWFLVWIGLVGWVLKVVGMAVRAGVRAPWHPGRCAELLVDDRVVGHAGELHPRVCEAPRHRHRDSVAAQQLDRPREPEAPSAPRREVEPVFRAHRPSRAGKTAKTNGPGQQRAEYGGHSEAPKREEQRTPRESCPGRDPGPVRGGGPRPARRRRLWRRDP